MDQSESSFQQSCVINVRISHHLTLKLAIITLLYITVKTQLFRYVSDRLLNYIQNGKRAHSIVSKGHERQHIYKYFNKRCGCRDTLLGQMDSKKVGLHHVCT